MTDVLYLSYDGMTDPLGQSQVLPYLEGLSQKGYRFTLISFEKPERLEKDRSVIEEICRRSNIDWHPVNYTRRPPILSTLFDISKLRKKAFSLHKDKKFALVHCRSYISALAGLSFTRKKNVPFLFDMRGFWADERIEGNIWNLKNPLYKTIYNFFKKRERDFMSGSAGIISLTNEGKKEILKMALPEVSDSKITVIPCCADLKLFDPRTISEDQKVLKKTELGIRNKYVVGYIGSIGTWYMLDEMLLAFKRISETKPEAVFLFVTKDKPQEIIRKTSESGIPEENIIVTSALHKEIPLFISLFDVSVFFIRPTFSKKASSPTKQGEIMAMGIPLICNSGVGDTDKIVNDYHAGIVLPDTTEKTLNTFNFDLSGFDADKAQRGAQDVYSLENGVKRYEMVYQSILQRK